MATVGFNSEYRRHSFSPTHWSATAATVFDGAVAFIGVAGRSSVSLDPNMRPTKDFAFPLAVFSLAFWIPAIGQNEPAEGSCAVISSDASGVNATKTVETLHVAAATASAGPFLLPSGSPASAKAVMCHRSSLVPALHDDKVVLAGYPFAIAAETKTGQHVLWLEIADGEFKVSYDAHVLTHEEAEAVQKRMNEFQNRLNSTSSAGASAKPHQ
jgi:hypothetical protein